MDINSITNSIAYEKNVAIRKDEYLKAAKDGETKTAGYSEESAAAVYEADDTADTAKVVERDDETIKRMTADLEQRKAQLRNLVDQILSKQSKTYTTYKDLFEAVKSGEVEVDPETVAKAKEDVAEDGYWGVEQTSDRLVSFAKALSGGNSEYADKLIDAVKEGFKQAEEAWGGELPGISRKTLDATIEKLEKWRDGTEDTATV